MSAWGKPLQGNIRKTEDHPTKSGITGFIATCLGITREMEKEYTSLSNIGYACREDLPGSLLKDFHTVQVGPGIVSERYYLVNAVFTICLWQNKKGPYSLNLIREALIKPVYAPFLGRKCCPLNLPPTPVIVTARDLSKAFDKYTHSEFLKNSLSEQEYNRIFWEGDDQSIPAERTTSCSDQPNGIRKYSTRIEYMGWKEASICT